MRIVVNDIAASGGGAMTILIQFYNYIRANDTENNWIFMLGDKYLEETDRIKVACFPKVKKSRLRKVLFDCFYGKRIVNSFKPDVVISLQNIITFGLKVPQAVYIHQSIPFQNTKHFSLVKKTERQSAMIQYFIGAFIKSSAKYADRVFVQTEWMREAVSTSVGIPVGKVKVAFPEIEKFTPCMAKFRNNRFFYPSNRKIYKNIKTVVEACNILNDRGIHDFSVRLTVPEGTVNHPNISCVGRLNREQMQEEYNSGTLLFPSYIETVGLPMLEARSCSTMILAGDTPFARECLAGYKNAMLFPVFSSITLAQLMNNIINGKVILEEDTSMPQETPSWEKILFEIQEMCG